MKAAKVWLVALSVGVLAACGGGGGGGEGASGDASTAASQSAEGLWRGKTSDGYNLTALVLENGELWALAASSSGVVGFLNGSASVSGSAVSGRSVSYDLARGTAVPQNFSGTVSTKNALALSTANGSFTAAYVATYDQAPTPLSALAGTYSGWIASVSGDYAPSSVVTISSAGQITSSGAVCSASGSITPRASGKNIYSITLGLTGASCPAVSTTLSGIASYDNATGALVVLALNGTKTDGLIYSATKQSNIAATYPLRSSYQALAKRTETNNYLISGSCNGTASESRTAAVPATFEGRAGYATITTLTGTYSNCSPASFAGTSLSHYDANYKPVGSETVGTDYSVIADAVDLPVSVAVGDTAQFGTVNVYSASNKLNRTGTRVLSYVVEADSGSNTALFNVIARGYNLSNQLLFTQQTRYRMTTSGELTAVSRDIQYSTTSTNRLVWTRY